MDIDKPKPGHGVREFLKEYAIVVVGVLTALGAEQLVEQLHWREQISATEEALLPEIKDSLGNSYERIAMLPCLRQRRTELRDRLLKGHDHWQADIDSASPDAESSKPALTELGRGQVQDLHPVMLSPTRPWSDGAYQAALASGVFNHMQRHEVESYARLHRAFDQMKEWQTAEQAAELRLSALAFDTNLNAAEKHEYLNALGEVGAYQVSMEVNAAQIILMADKAGIRLSRKDLNLEDASMRDLACAYRPSVPVDPS